MLHTYKTTPGDLAGYGGPKGIMGVGVILLVSLTSAMEGILRMQQMVVLRSSFWKILARIQPLLARRLRVLSLQYAAARLMPTYTQQSESTFRRPPP